ncbi:MAG: response regulator [Cyclobacteriaceae bacterium]|nr:response regulator [Cyclobacteriaceae bacterium]UYN86214.1 MAG: response regulator [Cyclobacteriaceae bacterium]
MKWGRVLHWCLLVLPSQVFWFSAQAQPSLAQHLTFPAGTVYEILRDSKGFMWFAASSGLYRYDGYTTIVYKHDPGNPNSLSESFITALQEDRDGNLWVGTLNGGLNKFLTATNTAIRLNKSSADKIGIPGKSMTDIDIDDSGNVWVISGKPYKINPVTLAIDSLPLALPPDFGITKILFGRNNTAWIGSNGDGFGVLNKTTGQFEIYRVTHPDAAIAARANVIRNFQEDDQGTLWLATYGGLVQFNPATKSIRHWINKPDDPFSLRHNSLWNIYPDKHGKIWIASWGGGLSYYDATHDRFENNMFKPGSIFGINSNEARSFFADRDGTFWLGTNGDGIYKLKPIEALKEFAGSGQLKQPIRAAIAGKRYHYFLSDQHGLMAYSENEGLVFTLPPFRDRKPNGLGGNFVSGVVERGDGKIFIGTDFGITEFDPETKKANYYFNIPGDNTSLSHNSVNSIFIDSKNRLWAGTPFDLNLFLPDKKQFFKFRKPEFFQKSIMQFLETDEGLWLGTATGGLLLFNAEKDSIIHNFQYEAGSKGLSNNYITALFQDHQNYIWIGTRQGLNRYNPNTKKVERMHTATQLDGSSIGIIAAGKGYEIFIQSDHGLYSCFRKQAANEFEFVKLPSPVSSSVIQLLSVKDRNYNLVIADKVYQLPYSAYIVSTTAVPIVITQFSIDPNNSHPLDSSELVINPSFRNGITLAYDQNLFSIEFSLLDFTDPNTNEYAYMLENFDNTWTYSGTRRFVTYTNISPGTYIFHAKGKGHNEAWNEEGVSMVITVLPPPWKTWWAYTTYGIILIGLLWAARKNIINRERLKAQVALEQKEKQTLRELDHLKTKFFSNITHEFRTPLTLIQGPADNLLEKTTDKETVQQLNLIKSNAQRLLKLINQLLDLAKLDANETKLDKKPLNLASLCRATIAQFTSMAESRNISFQWQLTEPIPTVVGDEEKIETILINLMSNALKFTPSGGNVKVFAQFQDDKFLFKVEDTGRGIPANKLEHIFDRFYQVEASDSSHAEGTGIGLALVKEYVELMRGIIHVQSIPGKGTVFTVTLPLQPSTTQTEPDTEQYNTPLIQQEATETNGEAHLPMLLLVEDNEDIRTLIKSCLGAAYRYREARHGKEGLEKARTEIPDMIISDLMMPEMDGLEFCERVKKDPNTNHIPFIMLTAKAADEHKLTGLQTGADDYLIKPFNKQELIFKVQNLVQLREKLQEHIKLNLLTKATPVKAVSASEQFIMKAKTFVESNLGDASLSVERLAEELNLGREQCYRKIMALTGLSPSAFIRKLKLQRAAQLLAAKAAPVSQVAYQVGYENLSHFSKAFKEEFGKLPSEYS